MDDVFIAENVLSEAIKNTNVDLGALVAGCGLWVNPEVHNYLNKENGYGSWRPNVRRAASGEKRRTTVHGVFLDDNTYANSYIKTALGLKKKEVVGFEACHIWPESCYHEMYHTTTANIVLLPRAIASLTDHCDEIKKILQYRAFELYGWYPTEGRFKENKQPEKPENYPCEKHWREPQKKTDRVDKSLKNRTWAKATA